MVEILPVRQLDSETTKRQLLKSLEWTNATPVITEIRTTESINCQD